MRNAFIKELSENVEKDRNIILITADLGFSVLEDFMKKYPNNYFNVGLTEQNMIGVAAGLALRGKKVFVYSITPFVTSRCFEQIKINVAYHNLDVTLVGVGAGMSYSKSGSTHHSFEDIGIIRTLPNFSILCPGDPVETQAAVRYALSHKGPKYLRLGKNHDEILHKEPIELKPFIKMADGNKGLIITTGNTLVLGRNVRNTLEKKHNMKLSLISCPIIKPFDEKGFLELVSKYKYVFSIEEHVKEGGFGSLLSEVLAESDEEYSFKRFYMSKGFLKTVGSQEYLRSLCGLSEEYIVKNILNKLDKQQNQ